MTINKIADNNKDFLPYHYQIALFFSDDYRIKPLKSANLITEKLSGIFSVEPSVQNFNFNMPIPPSVPRIALIENDIGQILANDFRADLYLSFNDERNLEEIPSMAERFADCFSIEEIVRIGLICNYRINENIDTSYIKAKYIVEGKMQDAFEIQFGWTNSIELSSYEVQQYIYFNIPKNNERILTIDHNTKPNKPCSFKEVNEICKLLSEMIVFLGEKLNDTIKWN